MLSESLVADGVVDTLRAKRKNTRVLSAPAPGADPWHVRPVTGGLLVQDPYAFVTTRADWRVVTERIPRSVRDERRRPAWGEAPSLGREWRNSLSMDRVAGPDEATVPLVAVATEHHLLDRGMKRDGH